MMFSLLNIIYIIINPIKNEGLILNNTAIPIFLCFFSINSLKKLYFFLFFSINSLKKLYFRFFFLKTALDFQKIFLVGLIGIFNKCIFEDNKDGFSRSYTKMERDC